MRKRHNDAGALSKPWQGRFHSFLVQKRLAPEDKANYFIRWVERFLQTASADAASEAASAFLDELSRQEEPWKVQQAHAASTRR